MCGDIQYVLVLYEYVICPISVVSIEVDSCDPIPTDNPWVDCDLQVVAVGFDDAPPAAAKFDSQGGLHVVDQSGAVFKVNTAKPKAANR